MFDLSREARTHRRRLRSRQSSRGVALLIVLVLGMLSALAVRSTAQTASAVDARSPKSHEIRVRKSVTALTDAERKEFVDAVLALKRVKSPYDPSLSYYDQFVAWHKERYICHSGDHMTATDSMLMIHTGPMFLPWHRELLVRFERALREVSGKEITVPYWDWTDPDSVSPGNPHAVFRDDFMGGDGKPDEQYAVTTGPFKKGAWTLNIQPGGATWTPSATTYLTRRLGRVPALPTKAQVEAAFAAEEYDVSPYSAMSDPDPSFRSALEGTGSAGSRMDCGPDGWMALPFDLSPAAPAAVSGRSRLHNLVHTWVGGSLSPPGVRPAIRGTMVLPTSPNDPIFFLHHANIDRLWGEWQAAHPGKTYKPESGYSGNNADSAMAPFGDVSPQQVENIGELGYRYR
jgi:tyrosinase